MKNKIVATLIFVFVIPLSNSFAAHDHHAAIKTNEPSYVTLDSPGSKNRINNNLYFTYDFDKTPAMGMVIVRIRVFDKNEKQVTTLAITGDSGMPSMGSAHDSGETPFRLNKKGTYLLPVNVVMPGDWEVKIRIKKGNKVIYAGKILFNV